MRSEPRKTPNTREFLGNVFVYFACFAVPLLYLVWAASRSQLSISVGLRHRQLAWKRIGSGNTHNECTLEPRLAPTRSLRPLAPAGWVKCFARETHGCIVMWRSRFCQRIW